jgi:dolichyl-phosphate-mannose--protein O-mannosyl transferase/Gpi18-like mannosyltransferase
LRSAVGEARAKSGAASEERSILLTLAGLLLVALLVRLLFIGADGFKTDVSTFEAWALLLSEHPLNEFFAKASFADYPPGYFYVLWLIGHLYKLLVHSDPTYGILKIFVKLPGIVMDLVDAALIFAIVRRFASLAWAFGASAFFAFNPAVIFVSAYWGQVDSVAAALVLGAILLVFDAATKDAKAATSSIVWAWVLTAASILIKPPAVVLVPLLLAFSVATEDRARRLFATALGVGAALVFAFLATIPFHPTLNPIDEFAWLYGRYQYASSVYPYNSVNAFNLYSMVHHFWEPDSQLLPSFSIFGRTLGIPQYGWGIVLFLAAVALVVSRYVHSREPTAFLEGAMVLSLGYFVLLTRMHERYVFDALLLAVPLAALRTRYLWAAIVLSLTLLGNLFYSLDYLVVMNGKIHGVDPSDLFPWLSHPMSLLNVAVFFYLGFVYLGAGAADPIERIDLSQAWQRLSNPVRHWFLPLEGVVAMTRVDWLIAAGMTVGSFALTALNYQYPNEKIFDEIYYARAGEEYLKHKEIFEFTHPPLTKLIITASMLLFGGLHGAGDSGVGWRFLNLVVGAVMVLVIYWFAKRLLGSTPFATLAAGLLLLDGFHYVQSRIATPEITVAFFSLLTLYAFYRFWIASQVRVAPQLGPVISRVALTEGVGIVAATALALAVALFAGHGQTTAAKIVLFLYVELGAYIAVRLLAPFFRRARALVSYAEGSTWSDGTLTTFDGGSVAKGGVSPGEATTAAKRGLVYNDEELLIKYERDGSAQYVTPQGEATFEPSGTMSAGAATIDGSSAGRIWLWILAACGGCLAASKWNGLFDFFVIWLLAVLVASQRLWRPLARILGRSGAPVRPASWGNPFGFSVDLVIAVMLFVGATIYVLTYIPYFQLASHTFSDLIALQRQMYDYHNTLTATHPYGSKWWEWPLILRPISYYYHDFRAGAATSDSLACCVAEILALPNPVLWWLGLISVPFIAYLAVRERNKGYLLLVTAYFFQWLPWIASPRVAFEYHFLPNLAVICLADAVLMQRIWNRATDAAGVEGWFAWPRPIVWAFSLLVVWAFVFFYPVYSGIHVPWNEWDARMLHWLFQNQWV